MTRASSNVVTLTDLALLQLGPVFLAQKLPCGLPNGRCFIVLLFHVAVCAPDYIPVSFNIAFTNIPAGRLTFE